MKLSPERRELVFESRRLTTFVLKKYFAPLRTVPDLWPELQGRAVEGLVDAAIRCHEPRRVSDGWLITNPRTQRAGRFSTYACWTIWGWCKTCVTEHRRKPRQLPVHKLQYADRIETVDDCALPPSPAISPSDAADVPYRREAMLAILRSLHAKDYQIVTLKFGLFDGRERTNDEIAALTGVSKARIGQRITRAFTRLREFRYSELAAL